MPLPKISFIEKLTHSSSPRLGYVLVICAAALAGLIHSVSKPMLEHSDVNLVEINPLTLAAVIFIINGLFFTPVKKNGDRVTKIGRKNIMLLLFIGIAEVSAIITYFFGLKESTAVNASILTNGEIIFSLLIAIVIFREKLQKKESVPFSLVIAGVVLLPLGYDLYQNGMIMTNLVFGDLLILLSGLFYALDINMCKYVSDRIDAKKITQIASFFGGGFALFLILIFQIPFEISLSHIPNIAVIGIFGTGISTFFFLIALRLIGAVRTILLYSSTSVFGMIFAGILLREEIAAPNIISIILVFMGIYWLRNRFAMDEKTISDLKGKFKHGKL
ncbi:MAG TPA: DMT family transporter [Nitrosopumilaceae archaeon]|nr:DMT family transporter [Nitrosopumilaceae archaeon]